MKKLFVLLFAFVFFCSIVFAGELDEARGNALNARYAHAECASNRAVALADGYAACVAADSTLDSLKSQLSADMSSLKNAADAADVKTFRENAASVRNDVKAIFDRLKELRKELKGKNNTEMRECLRQKFEAAQTEFASCTNAAVIGEGQAGIAWANAWVEHWNDVIANMSAKNLSTTEMQAVVGEMPSQVIAPLQTAVDSGDPEQIREAAKEARSLHLHLWARFSIAHVTSYLNALEPYAQQYELQDKVQEIRGLLSQASTLAQPGREYGEGEFEQVWSIIKDAATKTNELKKEIKDKIKGERE